MSKKIQQIRNFLLGVSSSPSASDVDLEAPIYSKNIDSSDEEGKLKGAKKDIAQSLDEDQQVFLLHLYNEQPSLDSTSSNTTLPSIKISVNGIEFTQVSNAMNSNESTDYSNHYQILNNFLKLQLQKAFTSEYSTDNDHIEPLFESITTLNVKIDSNGEIVEPDYIDIITNAMPFAIDASSESVSWNISTQSTDQNTFGNYVKPGDVIKIHNSTSTEYIYISNKIVTETTVQYNFVRGYPDYNGNVYSAVDWSSATEPDVAIIKNLGTFQFVCNPGVILDDDAIKGSYEANGSPNNIIGGNVTGTVFLDKPGIEINGRNFALTSNRDSNSTVVTNDLVYYEYKDDVVPPEGSMKIFKNFYKEGDTPRAIENPTFGEINSTNDGYPERVSLAKGANAVYIGSGGTQASKSQWLGKIQHKQFGNTFDGYHLFDSRLKSIDDGQSVFTLDYLEPPVLGSNASSRPSQPNWLIAKTPGSRALYALSKYTGYPTGSSNQKGKQFKSESLFPFTVSAIATSTSIHKKARTTGTTNFKPFANTWNGSDNNVVDSHQSNTTYLIMADANEPNKLYFGAAEVLEGNDGNGAYIDKFLTTTFGASSFVNLIHEIEITSKEQHFTNLDIGTKIKRSPKAGSYINDIYEKNGVVYIQYGHNSGFTFDEEWLYCFNISDVIGDPDNSYNGELQSLGLNTISVKPITPPTIKVKNYQNDYRNKGKDWYGPDETCDFGGITSQSWIGQDWFYGSYANYIRWRNIDILGFLPNKKHCKYKRDIDSGDGYEIVDSSDSYWNKVYAAKIDTFSDDEEMNVPTFSNTDSRNKDNPKSYSSTLFNEFDIGPINGYTAYSVFTNNGGITDHRDGEGGDGEIGCAVFMDATQITSRITVNKGRKSESSGFLGTTKKRYHYLYNTTPIEKDEINEMKLLVTNKDSYGVSQRIFPLVGTDDDGTGNAYLFSKSVTTTDPEDGTTSTVITKYYVEPDDAFRTINGGCLLNDSDGSNALPQEQQSYLETAANLFQVGSELMVKPMKNAWRYGIYGQRRLGNGNYPNQYNYNMVNRYMVNLGSGQESTQVGNPFSIAPPNDTDVIGPVSRNYFASDTIFWTTGRQIGMPKTNTYLSKWNKTIGSSYDVVTTGSGIIEWSASNIDNPFQQENIGNASIVSVKHNNDITHTLSPNTGIYQTGELKYDTTDQSGTPWTAASNTNSTYGSNFDIYPSGALNVGMDIDFSEPTDYSTVDGATVYENGNFNSGITYYWKISFVYDGFQEGPLSEKNYDHTEVSVNYKTASLNISLSNVPIRASHMVLYRKNAVNDFYRMVKEVSLDSGWVFDEATQSYTQLIIDEGQLGATYEAITGIPELLKHTNINYGLSTVAQGHLVVADCFHPEIKQGQQFVFKSEPNSFSNFNWAKNYCVLPTKPTALTWFGGKIYLFDLANTYTMNLNNMVLEDTFEGVGCFNQDSLIVTDLGMFFCDNQNMYYHNGSKTEAIGQDVVTSSFAEDTSRSIPSSSSDKWNAHAWQNINHNLPPKALYDARGQSVYFCFQDKHSDGTIFNGAWKFGLNRKRWDLQELPEPFGVFSGIKNDVYVSGDNKFYSLAKYTSGRKNWSWNSKKYDLSLGGQDKVYYSVDLILNNNSDASLLYNDLKNETSEYGSIDLYFNSSYTTNISNQTITQKTPLTIRPTLDKEKITLKITGNKKAKWIQVCFKDMKVEIDGFNIVYKAKSIK